MGAQHRHLTGTPEGEAHRGTQVWSRDLGERLNYQVRARPGVAGIVPGRGASICLAGICLAGAVLPVRPTNGPSRPLCGPEYRAAWARRGRLTGKK